MPTDTKIATKKRNVAAMPAYRERRPYGQAIITLTDAVTGKRKDYWLGDYGSPASREMYARVIAQWESLGRRLPPPVDAPKSTIEKLTVNEVIHAYKRHVDVAYKPMTRAGIYMVLRLLRQYFGSAAAEDFGPNSLRLLREQMIKGDPQNDPPRKPWSRTTVNKACHQMAAMFKWAASHEMLPVSVQAKLKTVEALRRGRSDATDYDPVQPVPIDVVEATKPYLCRQVRALVDLQLLTGARGGELLTLRRVDLDMTGRRGMWAIRPSEHKAAHHGHQRVIPLGPKARAVIRLFLVGRALDAYLFSPAEAEAERRDAARAKRKTPVTCGNRPGTNRVEVPARKAGDHYSGAAYRRAIDRACDRAGVPRWHPHQLRHTAGTRIRQQYGLEAAQIILGHSSAQVTDAVYAQRDMDSIVRIVQKIG
jgi:integrase